MPDTCNWPGTSGKTYAYEVFPIGHSLKAEAGNYIYAKTQYPRAVGAALHRRD
jgi:hypothetical protein